MATHTAQAVPLACQYAQQRYESSNHASCPALFHGPRVSKLGSAERRHELGAQSPRQWHGHCQKYEVQRQCEHAMAKAVAQHRQIQRLGKTRNGISTLGAQFPADEQHHQNWNQRDGKDG